MFTTPCRFRYKFKANVAGTSFYHSHSSFQRGDGLSGPYIVRTPADEDPNSNQYDFDLTEHYITVQEWFHKVFAKLSFLHNIRTNCNFENIRIKTIIRIRHILDHKGSICFTSLGCG